MILAADCVLEQVAQTVFSTMLNTDLIRIERLAQTDPELLLATVQIAGQWTGSVVLAMPPEVARAAAATMLQLPSNDVTAADQQDTAAELVNMIGGNVKSLLPGPSFLSLPTIVAGREFGQQIHDAEIIDDVKLMSQSGILRVTLYAKVSETNRIS